MFRCLRRTHAQAQVNLLSGRLTIVDYFLCRTGYCQPKLWWPPPERRGETRKVSTPYVWKEAVRDDYSESKPAYAARQPRPLCG